MIGAMRNSTPDRFGGAAIQAAPPVPRTDCHTLCLWFPVSETNHTSGIRRTRGNADTTQERRSPPTTA